MIPGELFPTTATSSSTPAARRLTSTSRTPAIGRSRSARTTTSTRPTTRCSSIAPQRADFGSNIAAGTAVRFEPGQAAHGRARRARRRAHRLRLPRRRDGSADALLPRKGRACRQVAPGRKGEGAQAHAMKIGRRAYAEMFGPTVGDRVRLADTEPDHRSRARPHCLRRGSEVRRRQGHPRRHGPKPAQCRATRVDTVITNALILDWLGHRQSRHRRSRTDGSRASAKPAIRTSSPVSTSSSARARRSSRAKACIVTAGGIDSHIHFICPQQIDEALHVGRHDDDRRRHRTRHRHVRDDVHAGPLAHPAHAGSGGRVSDEPRLSRQRQREPRPPLARAGRGRRRSGSKLHEDWGTTPAAIDAACASPTNSTCRSRSTPTR